MRQIAAIQQSAFEDLIALSRTLIASKTRLHRTTPIGVSGYFRHLDGLALFTHRRNELSIVSC